MMSCGGISHVMSRRETRTSLSIGQRMKIKPGPLSGLWRRPRRKTTARSYSRNTFKQDETHINTITNATTTRVLITYSLPLHSGADNVPISSRIFVTRGGTVEPGLSPAHSALKGGSTCSSPPTAYCRCSLPGFRRRLNHQGQAFNLPHANARTLGDSPGRTRLPQFPVHPDFTCGIEVSLCHTDQSDHSRFAGNCFAPLGNDGKLQQDDGDRSQWQRQTEGRGKVDARFRPRRFDQNHGA